MKRAKHDLGIEWLEFEIESKDEDGNDYPLIYRFHLNFLLSNWKCTYGEGCQGLFGIQDSHTVPDIGCCRHGAWFTDNQDHADVTAMIENLTDEDWDKELRARVEKKGWDIIFSKDGDEPEDEISGKTKVFEGGCVFANRADGSVGSTGKIGCAFHHAGQRLGMDHVDAMPDVCWQLPLRLEEEDTDRGQVFRILPWDVEQWGGADADETHDSWLCHWCVDTPDAYCGTQPVYRTMEHELRQMIGDAAYEKFTSIIAQRPREVAPMPGQLVNGGRPLLPLLVVNRTPKRVAP